MTIATYQNILTQLAQGKGCYRPLYTGTSSSGGTSAAAGSGFISGSIALNAIGTSYPGTRIGVPVPAPASQLFTVANFMTCNSVTRGGTYGRFYELGTLSLTATGNQFTHANTFTSLTRTRYGQTLPINMIPLIYVSTATTTTAPILRLRVDASTAGYTDQDGNGVIGTTDFTFPNVATATGSTYILMLESGDTSVQDIIGIDVTTASSTGAAVIMGFEPIALVTSLAGGQTSFTDAVFSGYGMTDEQPAVVNTGTAVTSYLGWLLSSIASTGTGYQDIMIGVNN
jgi:hypothetical protein